MVVYTFNTETHQIFLKGEPNDIELLNRIKTAIRGAHSRQRMNYKPDILKELIQLPTLKETYCELSIQCKDREGVAKVVTILTDEFESEVVYEKDIKQDHDNQKLTSSLSYYETKSKASPTNKVLLREESKTNDDNINNQNRPSNNSF